MRGLFWERRGGQDSRGTRSTLQTDLGILSISRLTDNPTSIRDSPSNGLEMSNDLV